MVKCNICNGKLEETFLNKIKGTYVKIDGKKNDAMIVFDKWCDKNKIESVSPKQSRSKIIDKIKIIGEGGLVVYLKTPSKNKTNSENK